MVPSSKHSREASETAFSTPANDPIQASHAYSDSMARSTFSTFKGPCIGKDDQQPILEISIASTLQAMFGRLLDSKVEAPSHPSDHILDGFRKHLPGGEAQPTIDDSMLETSISYEDLFFILAQECIEMLALRFGELGCHQLESERSRYFVKSLSHDTSTTMFDPPRQVGDLTLGYSVAGDECGRPTTEINKPLLEYNNHSTTQMVEIWFSQHPFPFIFSKTLLLRDIRHNTHNELLLAAILADVQYGQETQDAHAKGEILFAWASARLREMPQKSIDLATIQAVVLLGWRSLCSSQSRRAICYFIWASCAIQTVPTPQLGLNTINGIDVGEIESECRLNTQWLVFSVILWATMQVDSPNCEPAPDSAPTAFPVADESASASLKLDRTSYNFSTLQNQERMFRELWLLSHVSATVSHIHALYPRSEPLETDEVGSASWQSHTLLQLRRLSSQPQDISLLCRRVIHVLLGAVQLVETQAEHSHSQALALSASHMMLIIHFLVPSPMSSGSIAGRTKKILAAGGIDQLVSDFCYSTSALLKTLAILNDRDRKGARRNRAVMSQRHPSSIVGIFALALDACGRGLNWLFSIGQIGSEMEQKCIRDKRSELARLASELYAFSDCSLLSTVRIRIIKKQLEIAMHQFSDVQFDFSTTIGGSMTTGSASSKATGGPGTPYADPMDLNDKMVSSTGDFSMLDNLESKYLAMFFGNGFSFISDACDADGMAFDLGAQGDQGMPILLDEEASSL
ncbi:hypothetical protein VE03_05290 [Pseudogymnoascus sp. 23342-1-I1]|nr:hypothetical protein VE03_05290 [Pseudogymnoascus sp. 23342-1-I1]